MILFSNSQKNQVLFCHSPEIPLMLMDTEFVQDTYAGDVIDMYKFFQSILNEHMLFFKILVVWDKSHLVLPYYTTCDYSSMLSPFGFAHSMSSEHPLLLKRRIHPCKKNPYYSSECDSVMDCTFESICRPALPCRQSSNKLLEMLFSTQLYGMCG